LAGVEVRGSKNMVNPRTALPVNVVKGEVTLSCSLKGSIKEGGERRCQMMPVIMNYMRWVPINSIRTAVPITSDEGNRKGIKKEGFILKRFKKFKTVRWVCMGVHVHDLKNMAAN
jgi:hypothetical protein